MSAEINGYQHDFAFVNKSYEKDLHWSVTLFRSWFRSSPKKSPFYIIVPSKDIDMFSRAFARELAEQRIGWLPHLMTEESLFHAVGIEVPKDFDGWRIQQIVKLCFAKTGYARNYLTVDSSMIFGRALDPDSLLQDGEMSTAADPISKSIFFGALCDRGEKGWLDGELVSLSQSFDRICSFLGNTGPDTNAYISCTGMFNSDLAKELEAFAREKGVDGYVGLLRIAPYEFAWYGEFVFSQRRERFRPRSPHIMTLAHSEQQAAEVLSGTFKVHDGHFGYMFQPPAAHLIDPEVLDKIISEKRPM